MAAIISKTLFLSSLKPQNSHFLQQTHPQPQLSLSNSNSHPRPPTLSRQIPNNNKHHQNQTLNHYFYWLNLSVNSCNIELAKAVHAKILKIEENTRLFNSLIVAYLKLGSTTSAHKVLKALSRPDVVSYTAIVSALAKCGREIEALELFFEMRSLGIEANEFSFVAILTACTRIWNVQLGFQLHCLMMKLGFLDFTYVGNALMGLYGKCGCIGLVLDVFDEMLQRDMASWNTAISALVNESMYDEAFELFHDMLEIDGFKVDHFTLSTLLAASTGCSASKKGRELHAHGLKIGLETNLSVNNALIGFYTECGSVKDVVAVFERMPLRDVITWTAMITSYSKFGQVDFAVEIFDRMPNKNCVSYNAMLAGYCQNGKASRALNLFIRMVEEGIELSDFTLTSAANACGLLAEKKTSEQIQGFVLKFGFGSNDFIEAALVDMCTRCGRMADAEKMFDRSPSNQSSSIIWTSMICGYARDGRPHEAICLFCRGQSEESMGVDEFAYAAVLGVCGMLGFHSMGEQIHCCILKSGFLSDTWVANVLIRMYCKCGYMMDAIRVLDNMPRHDIASYNGLMAGHILNWEGNEALALWAEMEKTGVQPDSVTFSLIISAYRYTNSNLVDECLRLFDSMKSKYEIEPTSEHYASLVSVLGYWGLLKEAEEMINTMPFEPEVSVWRALLDSCRIRLNSNIGKRAAKQILAMDPQDPSTYILVANLYSASARWHCSETVREEMREKGFKKRPSQSWIFNQNKIHLFYARDESHYQSKDIYSGLEILIVECLKAGYVPDTNFVLHEVEEYQKKDFLFYHSAKLAVTYGLLMNRPGKPIRVMKNILLCGDCHTFFKYVSIVTKREIHVRDGSGFHRFLDGCCSCKNYGQ
ncbi:hypothetical protein LguiB_000843 [Lonicera macranthoides]